MKVRHKDISFKFQGKSNWAELTAEEIEAFETRHPDMKLEREGIKTVTETKLAEDLTSMIADIRKEAEQDDFTEPDENPTYSKGWYSWHGSKYRKADLPPAARALIEE